LGVHPDFQGIGIGTMLIDNCEQIAKREGAWEIAASSPVGSQQLIFYNKERLQGIQVCVVFKYKLLFCGFRQMSSGRSKR
jgi:GNAT superfamily N-acetyltransferase